jgi:2-phosphosulfolactate phosphatase
MSLELYVHLLPEFARPEEFRGGAAVVLDVLRASTTIIHALANGARGVLPCATVEEALSRAAGQREGAALLGGERDGRLIYGFDLDNSPEKYTPEVVGGKTIIFTTTNGTRAFMRCRDADRILIGAFTNLSAVVNELARLEGPAHLVCAGTRGQITIEDCLCAGAIATALKERLGRSAWNDDSAGIAMDLFAARTARVDGLVETLKRSRGGRNLMRLGFEADILRAAQCDLYDVVPEYSTDSSLITAPASVPAGG